MFCGLFSALLFCMYLRLLCPEMMFCTSMLFPHSISRPAFPSRLSKVIHGCTCSPYSLSYCYLRCGVITYPVFLIQGFFPAYSGARYWLVCTRSTLLVARDWVSCDGGMRSMAYVTL